MPIIQYCSWCNDGNPSPAQMHAIVITHVYHTSSPADHALLSIKSTSQLTFRLHDLALQHCLFHHILAILRPNPSQPNTLRRLSIAPSFSLHSIDLLPDCAFRLAATVHHHVGGVFVPANVRDEVDSDAAGSLVVQVAV